MTSKEVLAVFAVATAVGTVIFGALEMSHKQMLLAGMSLGACVGIVTHR